ncbi:MBL fold metallo-hydrolase [Sphingobacterium sp. SGL-16]|uniref:MBL fold metallo-hydrolase n=1 Tax=Sphingobacterium sp. SGL-16 TaxID=2710883 RepID=UPI0013EE0BB5|nr:MBL fold metallo-hydrolase [Sphingobacterium sp. SGL-16]NGM72996.1 MBL fold metallo-hydrolase [Sphingobacterium sp. SGL-16]
MARKIFKKTMQILLVILLITLIGGMLYMRSDRFGINAAGARLERMQKSPNYKNGAFDNLENTPALAEDASYSKMLRKFFFEKKVRNSPSNPLPVIKTDLKNLPIDSNLYVWFGHSSYLLQLDGKKILVDPVLSEYASPVRISAKAFPMEYVYQPEDMPEIDILVITHDHWDHLDYNTLKAIQQRVKHIVTGLGVAAHLEKWGFPTEKITELYWGEEAYVDGFKFTSATARHFSGRTFTRNTTLWSSFILHSITKKIYIGGDSGYGKHFKEIGEQYGPFDYAILENGQYNQMWKYIHMMPEEVITAANELKAKYTMPVHSSKFALAMHEWDDSLIRVAKAAEENNYPIVTPKIGQVVSLDNYVKLPNWWEGID